MVWIGLIAALAFLFCLISTIQTARLKWGVGAFWCGCLLWVSIDSHLQKQMDGLVILILVSMAFMSMMPLFRIKGWNQKKRKSFSILYGMIFLSFMLEIGYCLLHIPIIKEMSPSLWNYQPGSGTGVLFFMVIKIWCVIMVLASLGFLMTNIFFEMVDRFFSKHIKITLLRCRVYQMGMIRRLYILEGIQNGVIYHFRLTPKAYRNLKSQNQITLDISKGCFGGLYCSKIPVFEKEKQLRKTVQSNHSTCFQKEIQI